MFFNNSFTDQYGALPYLGGLWAFPALIVFFVTLAIDYGFVNGLMDLEDSVNGPKRRRIKFRTFVINDTVIIPPFLALCAAIMHAHPNPRGWYTASWWHWLALLGPLLGSIVMELDSVRKCDTTWSQQLSPAKLWHTLIFGVMGYWMITGLVASTANGVTPIETLVPSLFFFVWAYVVFVYEPRWLKKNSWKVPPNAFAAIGIKNRWLTMTWSDDD